MNISEKNRVFLIGSGPSLNDFNMSLLKNETTIAMNRSYISYKDWGFDPTYYVIIDRRLIHTLKHDIEKLLKNSDIKQFFILKNAEDEFSNVKWLTNIKKKYPNKVSILNHPTKKEIHKFPREVINDFNLHNIRIRFRSNAGTTALELCYIMGYKETVLLGIDAKYHSTSKVNSIKKDINHYNEKYFEFGKFIEGKNQGKPTESASEIIWEVFYKNINKCKDFKIYTGTKTLNPKINEFFEYKDYNNILKIKK